MGGGGTLQIYLPYEYLTKLDELCKTNKCKPKDVVKQLIAQATKNSEWSLTTAAGDSTHSEAENRSSATATTPDKNSETQSQRPQNTPKASTSASRSPVVIVTTKSRESEKRLGG